MNHNTTTAVAIGAALAAITALALFDTCHHRTTATIVHRDTVRDTTTDTLREVITINRPTTTERTRTEYVRVAVHDTLRDTIVRAHDGEPSVTIPITQAHYRDSLYEAWVSGYAPSLDSVRIYRTTVTHTVRTRNRWNVGIQCGVGITPKGIQPYLGLGASFNLNKK